MKTTSASSSDAEVPHGSTQTVSPFPRRRIADCWNHVTPSSTIASQTGLVWQAAGEAAGLAWVTNGLVRQDSGMHLPVMPHVAPMLAKAVEEIPAGAFLYEPKWDGFRSIVFRDGAEVEIGSRNERPMTRYFPEVVEAIKANLPERCVVDGEIVVPDPSGRRLEFEALQLRIHPAAR
jgi:ATP-dependent DNA ligase